MQGPLIGGPRSRCFIMDTSNQAAIMGLHFKPAGAASFFKLPVGELHNAVVPLEMLWGAEAWDLQDQLFLAATPGGKFRVLEQALLRHLSSDTSRHPVVSFALRELQHMADMLPCIYSPDLLQKGTIADLVEQTGISHRRFVQLFTEATGLKPKLFWRIQRFQLALRLTRRAAPSELGRGRKLDAPHSTMNWSEIALACGYFDQAHFIHDFQAFSGTAPTVYLAAQGESMNHVPLPD
jgi:AraC-like DNA-binding protein